MSQERLNEWLKEAKKVVQTENLIPFYDIRDNFFWGLFLGYTEIECNGTKKTNLKVKTNNVVYQINGYHDLLKKFDKIPAGSQIYIQLSSSEETKNGNSVFVFDVFYK